MKKTTVLPAFGKIHAVTKEVYIAFYKNRRHYKYITQEMEKGKLISYEKALDEHIPLERLIRRPYEDMGQAVVDKLYIKWLLEHLDDEERKIIRLYYFSQWTQREIANELGVSQNAIKKRLQHIIKKLKKIAE